MKKILIALNIVLLLLVAFLYYLHFSNLEKPKETSVAKQQVADQGTAASASKIAYIDLDSLQKYYKFYQKVKGEFETKQTSGTNEIASLQKKYQARTNELQQKANTMTPQEQEKAMMEINQMQQNFQARKQTIDNDLFEYNNKIKEQILTRLEDYLKEFNKDHKYTYIFSYEPGFMFYKDPSLNITNEVVEGLNQRYETEGKAK